MSKKYIIITSAGVILLAALSLIAYLYFRPVARTERYVSKGKSCMQKGKTDEAVQFFQKALSIDEKNEKAHLSLSALYISIGSEDKGEAQLKKFLRCCPKNIAAREELAKLFMKQLKIPEAERLIYEIGILSPSADLNLLKDALVKARSIRASRENYQAALKLMEQKNYLEAIKYFSKVVKEDAENFKNSQAKAEECKKLYAASLMQQAKSLGNSKKYDEAMRILDKLLAQMPNDADAQKLKKDYQEAKKREEQAKASAASPVTEAQARELVAKSASNKYSNYSVMNDGKETRNGVDYYVIRVYQDHSSQITTLGYYYVEILTGKLHELDIPSNKLIP